MERENFNKIVVAVSALLMLSSREINMNNFTKEEQKRLNRCSGCKFAINSKCFLTPYEGKFAAEIENCPQNKANRKIN